MSSRIRTDAKHVFDCFLEIVAPQKEDDQPWILQSFPVNYKDNEKEKLKTVPHFVFPCATHITTIQHFSFVMTNIGAQWTFAFCRYAPNSETALCFLSCLPWHELFFKLLNQSAELLQSGPPEGAFNSFLSSVYSARLPLPGLVFHAECDKIVFSASTPSTFHLPSIPENRNLTEYFNAVDSHNMLIIFASMLHERRILVTSKKLSRLSACVQAANSLIYPMSWQHIFIPILPEPLMDYLSAPMPFLVGVPDPLMKRIKRAELGDVVLLDADNNKTETPFDDLESIPTEVLMNLKSSLKPGTGLLGDSVARAFLQALVHLIGGYRDALRYRQGEKITFSDEAFVSSRSPSIQPFLRQMLQIQLFRQFIDERVDLLNNGKGFSDEFELECVVFTEKSNKKFKNQYSALTHNVKREGVALARAVKDKANPAMKNAVRSVKDGGKAAKDSIKDGGKIARKAAKAGYRDVKSKFKDSNKEEMRDDSSSTQSAPSSPTTERQRSMTLPTPHSTPLTRNNTDMNFGVPGGRVLKYERFDPPSDKRDISPEFEELPRLEYNLMSELDEVIMRNKSIDLSDNDISKRSDSIKDAEAVSQDLISLDTGDDTSQIVFDPLAADYNNHQNSHRKLERVPRVTPIKYENYQPPGGSGNQPQFKDFIASMTESSTNKPLSAAEPRTSSDALLADYGINFNQATLTNTLPTVAAYRPSPFQPPKNGGYVQRPPPAIPPRTSNSSFLHSSLTPTPVPYSNNSQSERSVPPPRPCRDTLADLDPLNTKTANVASNKHLVETKPGLLPPTVPPRTKKQWTTFD